MVKIVMSDKAGELTPREQKTILPGAPSPGPSSPARPTRVARVPGLEGVDAMKKCEEIICRMRSSGGAEQRGGTNLSKTLHYVYFVQLVALY